MDVPTAHTDNSSVDTANVVTTTEGEELNAEIQRVREQLRICNGRLTLAEGKLADAERNKDKELILTYAKQVTACLETVTMYGNKERDLVAQRRGTGVAEALKAIGIHVPRPKSSDSDKSDKSDERRSPTSLVFHLCVVCHAKTAQYPIPCENIHPSTHMCTQCLRHCDQCPVCRGSLKL